MIRARETRRRPEGDDVGFTLIELLVVIIIIGILAAIAIPVYLHQREKGYDAQAQSDLRNLAEFETLYLDDSGDYGSGAAVMAAEPKINLSPGDASLRVASYTSLIGFCLEATTIKGASWYYDSNAGGLQPRGSTGCPTTYSTSDGAPIS